METPEPSSKSSRRTTRSSTSETPTPRRRRHNAGAENTHADKAGRRKACNQCKQQKLKCSLASAEDDDAVDPCTRCRRWDLECKVESGFQRTRKRRRSHELETEVRELRRQLETQTAATPSSALGWVMPPPPPVPQAPSAGQMPIPGPESTVAVPKAPSSSVLGHGSPPTTASGPSPDATEHSRAPGLTTKPGVDEPLASRRVTVPLPRSRTLGNTTLSVGEIDELFMIFTVYYHPFLPVIDSSKSPHEYNDASELLFWSIIAVASRRLRAQPTLLPRLARGVTDLLWKTLRSIPYSLTTVQSLALLCTWPFPTSSSTADPTFMLAGMMLQIGTQMGLHRALDAQDFVKVPMRLNAYEYADWVRTWEACNIVAQSVSVGCGLPIMIHIHDWSLTVAPDTASTTPYDLSMRQHLRIEQFCHRVSQALTLSSPSGTVSPRERLAVYRLLNTSLLELEREIGDSSPVITWYLAAARLHLHSFYLLDEPTIDGYSDRTIALYQTAFSLIELSLELDSLENGFFDFCPFFCYQVFVCAAFVVLKILSNGFFRSVLDENGGMKLLDAAIVALRKMSVVNNDLPARLGDVIAFFCTLGDRTVIGGATADLLRLQQVKNRLSMSVVYDALWTWRKQFQTEDGTENGGSLQYMNEWGSLLFGADQMQGALNLGPSTDMAGYPDLGWPSDT